MKKIFILIVSFISMVAHAQEDKNISGSVFDKTSGEALISVSVYYNNLPKGTITNAEGEFLIEKMTEGDSLVFSYVGYTTQKYSVNQLPGKIYLEPLVTYLPEVSVTPGSANKIAEQIYEKYNKIYESKSNNKNYSFFYRQITQTNGVYNEFIECFLTGNNTFNIENLKLQEGRYATVKKDSTYRFTFTNFFYMSQIKPFRQKNAGKNEVNTFIQPNFKSLYSVDIDDRFSDESGDILVLKFQPRKENTKGTIINSGKLYIRESDLSIIRFEGITQSNTKFQVNYKERTNTYPIVESVICVSDNAGEFNKDKKTVELKTKVTSTLFMVEQPLDDSGKKLKKDDTLLDVINKKKYNPEFWRNNPIVKRTKVDEEIIQAFEAAHAFDKFY